MKTYSAKPLELERTWWLIDAEGQTLGRLATLIANLLRGKHKPQFTPNIDTGDFIIVINAEKIKVSGNKYNAKLYRRHTSYPGGLRTVAFRDMQAKRPEKIIEIAVKGMLPHNTLGRQQLSKLNVYAGAQHPHAAQQPVPYVLETEGAE
ncbi:MAG: ribosomal protein [Vampirovibrio sp.]|jgi:large subunit ribosomal protein L13|nr:ribosomal protein [Vampirovibrio sp.]